jgi:pseudaminic acid cytidylyltransferase
MAEACISILPARGGSKRIPKKNIRPMSGNPLISYTIEAAIQSRLFERVVVSTDSPEIAEVALKYGAEVPFLRDASLADDHTPVSAATVDMLRRLDPSGDNFSYVCQLMPNCPLRTTADIVDSYRQFIETRADSQLSVVRYGWQNPWWAMRRNEKFELDPLFRDQISSRSQDLPELYCPTGAVWWAKADVLRREGTYHISSRTGWEIPWERGLDIDTTDDWDLAEVMFSRGQSVQKENLHHSHRI